MLPSCRHTSLLRRLRSWAMRPPRASSGGKMARLKRTIYSSPPPKARKHGIARIFFHRGTNYPAKKK
jgi:hypothetical protein